MTGGVSRGKTLERTCTYETRIPVSNARRDPMWLADDSVGICELNGCTCILEDGQTCPEFPQEDDLEGIYEGILEVGNIYIE